MRTESHTEEAGPEGSTGRGPGTAEGANGPNGMDDAQQALAAKYLHFAYKLANEYQKRAPKEREDLEAAALLALCEAAAEWDRGRGVPFPAFARKRIIGALNGALRSALRIGLAGKGKAPKVVSLDEEGRRHKAREGGNEGDRSGREVERFEERIRPLPKVQRDVCRKVFSEGLSYRQAGAALGFSHAFVARTRRQAIDKLRGLEASTN